MMYTICALILSIISLPNLAHSFDQSVNVATVDIPARSIHHGKERLESLKGNGRVTLDETQIVGYVEINGSLFTHGAHIGSANINGQATLHHTTVEGQCCIGGCILAEDCTFRSQIHATALKVTFTDCNINSIHMDKTLCPFGTQVVELSKCNLRGDVEFASGKGVVILKEGSEIQGKVVGASVKRT